MHYRSRHVVGCDGDTRAYFETFSGSFAEPFSATSCGHTLNAQRLGTYIRTLLDGALRLCELITKMTLCRGLGVKNLVIGDSKPISLPGHTNYSADRRTNSLAILSYTHEAREDSA